MGLIDKSYGIIHKFAYKSYVSIDMFVNARWYSDPYGTQTHASSEEYLQLAKEAKKNTSSVVSDYENEKGFVIDLEWLDDLALHTQIVKKESTLWEFKPKK